MSDQQKVPAPLFSPAHASWLTLEPTQGQLRIGYLLVTLAVFLADAAAISAAYHRLPDGVATLPFLLLSVVSTIGLFFVLAIGRRDVWLRVTLLALVLAWTAFKVWNFYQALTNYD